MIPHLSERALILAPHGRDADVAGAMLEEAGVRSLPCASLLHMIEELKVGAGFAIVTEEALGTTDLHPLADWLSIQPDWSDFPFILLTRRGGGIERNPAATRYLETLGNVTFLERPFHPTTLVSLARAARRARRRQYDARARLEELHAFASELEQRVEERTAESRAAQEQLHEAQKLETLGQLTGGVAHDFNNLLTPIIGALDMLQRKADGSDPRAERWVANALQSGERAKTLVQRLLGFARRQELQSSAIDVGTLIGGMRDLIASSLGPAIELNLDAADNLPRALADPNQLELAILNLCVNARDAMPNGGPLRITAKVVSLDARSETRLPPGPYIRISVIDNGIGMTEETLARAVEPFFSTKETGRGTGLGLSMVHGLTAQLGGAFALSSVLGQGTRADLYLPITDDAADPAAAGSGDASTLPPLPPMVLLVVDDEELVRRGTAEMLRDLGHRVMEADGGAEALMLLERQSGIDAVITDYKMPRMDGAELARHVREKHADLPILLISGYTGAADPIEGLPRVNKPFGLAELAEGLRRAIDPPANVVPIRAGIVE